MRDPSLSARFVVLLAAVGWSTVGACGDDVSARDRYAAQPTPELAWERFIELNRRRVKQVDLGIYDEAAKALVRKRNEDAGQDHIARLYRNAEPVVRTSGDRAAVAFLDDPAGTLAPWFFRRSAAGWQLDGHTPVQRRGLRRPEPLEVPRSDTSVHVRVRGLPIRRPRLRPPGPPGYNS